MELSLFIKRSKSPVADWQKTFNSLIHKDIRITNMIFIDNLFEIPYDRISSKWWTVIYDDEYVERRLLNTFPIVDQQESFDVFACYRMSREKRVTICPRLFRQGIRSESEKLYPILPVRMESLLDGWIFEHDSSANECPTT